MGDSVTGEHPETDDPKSYGEIFDEAFPHYLAMGMSPEEYWDGESWLKKSYRKAFRIRRENEDRIRDRDAWLQGVYIRDALQSVYLMVNGFVPKGHKAQEYPQKPRWEQAEEQKKEAQKKQAQDNRMQWQMAMFQAMAENFNKKFRENQENQNGQKAVRT